MTPLYIHKLSRQALLDVFPRLHHHTRQLFHCLHHWKKKYSALHSGPTLTQHVWKISSEGI